MEKYNPEIKNHNDSLHLLGKQDTCHSIEMVNSSTENTSGAGRSAEVPEGIKGWSWGAFLLNIFWAIGNKTWVGFVCIVPYIGILASFYLGFHGRELAWRNAKWDSVDHFNHVQKKWSRWGVGITVAFFFVGVASAFLIPSI